MSSASGLKHKSAVLGKIDALFLLVLDRQSFCNMKMSAADTAHVMPLMEFIPRQREGFGRWGLAARPLGCGGWDVANRSEGLGSDIRPPQKVKGLAVGLGLIPDLPKVRGLAVGIQLASGGG